MRDRAHGIGLRPGLIAATAILLAAIPGLHAQERPAEVRALWIVRATLSSPGSIATMVGAAKDGGFNTLLVQVATRQGSYAAGAPAGFDPIGEVIERAHEAGLRVHAWIDVTRVAGAAELPLSRDHLVYRHPTWAGIGASALSEQDIVASVQAARRLGAGGVILFSYDGLTGPSRGTEYLSQVGRAAFMQ